MKTKFLLTALMGAALISAPAAHDVKAAEAAANAANVKVYVDGTEVQFPDQKPYIDSGRTLIPVRFVSEALGAAVTWDDNTKGIGITLGDKKVSLQVDNTKVSTNGTSFDLDVPAKLTKEGRTVVPLRFVSEAMGANVIWNADSYTVQVQTTKLQAGLPAIISDAKLIIEKLPSFEGGKTMIGRKDVLFDPTGSGVFQNMSFMISYNSKDDCIVLTFNKFTDVEKPILKEILQHYYPKDFDAAYANVLELQKLNKHTYDGKFFSTYKAFDGVPVVWIGVK